MKPYLKNLFTLVFGLWLLAHPSFGQDDPGAYLDKLGRSYAQINKDTWEYIKQASKGKSANKTEKRRNELVNTLRTAKAQVVKTKPYQGDASMRDAVVNQLNMSINVMNNDFKKIVNLERIAEESYDDMEAYLLTKARVNAKMDSVFSQLKAAEKEFANKHGIKLIEDDSKLSKKLKNASEVNDYYNQLYLLFFKSYWYESKLVEAVGTGKVSDIEQYRQSLASVSQEGLQALRSIKAFRGEGNLKQACQQILNFYRNEANVHIPKQVDFFVKKDKMETISKNYAAKKKKSLTQDDVSKYNQAVADYNQQIGVFNKTNDLLNNNRSKYLNNWNKASNSFNNKFL